MNILPKSLLKVVEEIGHLPGVGPRTAERYAYYLLQGSSRTAQQLANTIAHLHEGVSYCEKTFCLVEANQKISPLYSDPARDKHVVLVVENPLDVVSIEKTGGFTGTYHVLGGLISPLDGIGPEQLHLKELFDRIKSDKVSELILATNASVEGESTALYIQRQLDDSKVKITRLARGLPVGVDIEYADQITLTRALEGRQTL